jgi:Fe2+ transport system protein FeoA
MKLDELDLMQRARISNIPMDSEFGHRLLSQGFTPGAQVLLINKLPFRGPLVVLIRDVKIALRLNQAKEIEVITE